jgi:subtilisin family serine protease
MWSGFMVGYTSETPVTDENDLAILRLGDPYFVAACLAAISRGQPSFTTPILARAGIELPKGAPTELHDEVHTPFFPDVAEALSDLTVTPDGSIQAFDPEEGRLPAGSFATAFTVTVPLAGRLGNEREQRQSGITNLVAAVRALLANRVRFELPPRVGPLLDFSVPSIRAEPAVLPPLPHRDGSGVLVGVVDWGCDFVHPAFRHPDGSTRLLYLWDQNAPGLLGATPNPGPAGLGTLFDTGSIDAALLTDNPYFALGYTPTSRLYADDGPVHGTHVLSVAAGNRAPGVFPGVAPAADLVFVHLPPNAVPTSIDPNSWALWLAVVWIFQQAQIRGQPAVVNLSLGTNRGPHDGSTFLEQTFDWLLAAPRRMIVVPAGNAHDQHLHAATVIPPGGAWSVTWRFRRGDVTVNALDIWYQTPTLNPLMLVTVAAPDGSRFTQPNPSWPLQIFRFGRLIGTLTTGGWSSQTDPALPFLQQIHIELAPDRVDVEEWTIELLSLAGAGTTVHAWVDRDDLMTESQSHLRERETDPRCTLGSLSCGNRTLCVGAYYEIPEGQPIAAFSSAGPTRDGRRKPDAAAPGYQVLAANALGGQLMQPHEPARYPLTARMSGTSVSVPHVTGLVALLMQTQGNAPAATIANQIRDFTQLRRPTSVPPAGPGARTWDPRFGYGRIDAAASLWPW